MRYLRIFKVYVIVNDLQLFHINVFMADICRRQKHKTYLRLHVKGLIFFTVVTIFEVI
jgi:hypothetical protein